MKEDLLENMKTYFANLYWSYSELLGKERSGKSSTGNNIPGKEAFKVEFPTYTSTLMKEHLLKTSPADLDWIFEGDDSVIIPHTELLEKEGSGKSSTGNNIPGKEAFKVGFQRYSSYLMKQNLGCIIPLSGLRYDTSVYPVNRSFSDCELLEKKRSGKSSTGNNIPGKEAFKVEFQRYISNLMREDLLENMKTSPADLEDSGRFFEALNLEWSTSMEERYGKMQIMKRRARSLDLAHDMSDGLRKMYQSKQNNSSDSDTEIVLLDKTGSGKSATGNTITGKTDSDSELLEKERSGKSSTGNNIPGKEAFKVEFPTYTSTLMKEDLLENMKTSPADLDWICVCSVFVPSVPAWKDVKSVNKDSFTVRPEKEGSGKNSTGNNIPGKEAFEFQRWFTEMYNPNASDWISKTGSEMSATGNNITGKEGGFMLLL